MRRLFLVLIPIVGFSLSGCAAIAKRALESAVETQSSGTSKSADTAYIAALTPNSKSGAGVVVFEPVIDATAKNNADLGTGIGRYLHFYVAGQGEFGKTTTLGHLDEVRRQYKLANWEVAKPTNSKSFKTVQQYAKSLGATHYAVGKFEKQNGVFKLSYALYPVNSEKVGSSWITLASPNQFSAKLPSMARQIALSVGAKSPTIPAKTALSDADLATIGAIPFLQKRKADKLSPTLAAKLVTLGAKDALAATLVIRTEAFPNENAGIALGQNAIKLAPNNSLALSEPASSQFSSTVTETLNPQIDAFNKKFPNNALGHHAAFWRSLNENDTAGEINSEEQAVQNASNNPYFWRYLSVAQSNEAASVRNARFAQDISRADWAKLNISYSRALGASQQSVKLDPQYSFGWSRLCNDATFVSDENTAFESLERALEIDDTNQYAWTWGAQLKQDKWFGSKTEYIEYEKRSAAYAQHFDFNIRDMTSVLTTPDERQTLRDILEVVIVKDPKNVAALSELGQYYHYSEANYPRAEGLYRQALAIEPNDGRTNSALGDLTYWTKSDPKTAEKLYFKALVADPKDGWVYGNLGRLYALTGRKAEGIKMAQKAKQFGCGSSHPVWEATGVTPP